MTTEVHICLEKRVTLRPLPFEIAHVVSVILLCPVFLSLLLLLFGQAFLIRHVLVSNDFLISYVDSFLSTY